MHTASPTVIAVDGRPASPAMAAALAAIEAQGRAEADRKSRIATDRRIIARVAARAALEPTLRHGVAGAASVFRDIEDGTSVRRKGIARLISARVALIDRDFVGARRMIRDAISCRRQAEHLGQRFGVTPREVVEAVNLHVEMQAAAR